MTKRERVVATLARRPVDRPAVAFWRHAPDVDDTAEGLARATLEFHRRWDLDLIKVTSSPVYCVEDWGCTGAWTGSPNGARQCIAHAVNQPHDWARIRTLDPGAGALGRELDALRRIARGRHDDAPVLATIFSPLTIARKLRGEALVDDLRVTPAAVVPALDAITDTMTRFVDAALDAGADGVFFATQTGSAGFLTEPENAEFGAPVARRVLERVRGRSLVTLLHIHGHRIFFDQLAGLPVHAINWHDRLTSPTLAEGKRRTTGAVVGGLDETATLQAGPADAIAAEVADAIRQTERLGLIVAPGCVLPLATPDAHLAAVVDAVRRA